MASTTLQNAPSSSSSPSSKPQPKYDVYLSFSSGDTGNTFTENLYRTLDKKRINTFRVDKNLKDYHRTDQLNHASRVNKNLKDYHLTDQLNPISAEILDAIEKSGTALVIFSENYVSSTWCLGELNKIVDCRKGGLKVLPIFYHVGPSDLQYQRGIFEVAFAEHEKRFNENTVQKWRAALTKVANLPGMHIKDGSGTVFIQSIVDKIYSDSSLIVYKDGQNGDVFAHTDGDNQMSLDLNKLVDGGTNLRRIGKLFVSNTEIAKGSNGTIVLEGIYEGRPVAVKRLVQAHNDVAFKEIQNLIASDQHPNIVRWYGVEHDQDFVYLSLERCTCNMDDLIQIYSDYSQKQKQVFYNDKAMIEYKARLESVKNIFPDLNLWKANGHPSPLLLKLMRDVVSGLVHLHELGIIHRDLKPHNVLIIKERSLCAKLSDMGYSKHLDGDMSSLSHHATGKHSHLVILSGWQAPEQLLHERETRAVDSFSLGCFLFFCITGGRHPFGDSLARDNNIVKNQMDLFLVEHIPEAWDLISCLLNPNPKLRPKALEVLHHPLFWTSEMRLSFIRDTSDRVELEDRETNSDLLKVLESVRDLLRLMRNKLNHYRELPKQIQVQGSTPLGCKQFLGATPPGEKPATYPDPCRETSEGAVHGSRGISRGARKLAWTPKVLVGPVPEGYDSYFASRFPRLFIEVYKVVYRHCMEEEYFQKYFKSNVD
uniref:non-specific serine/threonine protein kinase n=1 Tax=Fagus sylvatica TaxID=28930 RepID=A0A2N9GUT4_FAGSY